MKGDVLTPKQENFARNLFSGMSQRDAYIQAGYSSNNSLAVIDEHSCKLAAKDNIKIRIAELKTSAVDKSVMTVIERKKRLSELGRADLTDFMDTEGEPKLDKTVPNHTAASEYYIKTKIDKYGNPIVTKSIKLRDQIAAIQELNKMEKIYSDGVTLQDNRQVNIYTTDKLSEGKLKQLMSGDRPLTITGDGTQG